MFEIVRTIPGDSNFSDFENFIKEVYPADSPAHQIAEGINYEYLEAGYLVKVSGHTYCRAALYHNPHLYYQNLKASSIGNFEAVDDAALSAELIKHIALQAKQSGAQYLIGPMNGSTWDNYRFSVEHNYPPFFLEPYHHLYYNKHFLGAGFKVIANYYSSIETDLGFNNPAVMQREAELRQAGVVIRDLDMAGFEQELEKVFAFNSLAFQSNLLYTPVTKADFMRKYAQTKRLVDPRMVLMAEDEHGNLIGYFFCIQDFYNQQRKTLIAKTVARHPDKKWSGMGHVLGNIICKRAVNDGYQAIIHAFMYNEGTSNTMSKNFAGNPYKNYVLMGMELS